jgi:hypothetical protein
MDLKDDEQVKHLAELIKNETDSQKLMDLVGQLTELLDARYGPRIRRQPLE